VGNAKIRPRSKFLQIKRPTILILFVFSISLMVFELLRKNGEKIKKIKRLLKTVCRGLAGLQKRFDLGQNTFKMFV